MINLHKIHVAGLGIQLETLGIADTLPTVLWSPAIVIRSRLQSKAKTGRHKLSKRASTDAKEGWVVGGGGGGRMVFTPLSRECHEC